MITGHNKVKSRKAFLTKNQKNKLSKIQKKGTNHSTQGNIEFDHNLKPTCNMYM